MAKYIHWKTRNNADPKRPRSGKRVLNEIVGREWDLEMGKTYRALLVYSLI